MLSSLSSFSAASFSPRTLPEPFFLFGASESPEPRKPWPDAKPIPEYFKRMWRGQEAELNALRASHGLPPLDLEEKTTLLAPQGLQSASQVVSSNASFGSKVFPSFAPAQASCVRSSLQAWPGAQASSAQDAFSSHPKLAFKAASTALVAITSSERAALIFQKSAQKTASARTSPVSVQSDALTAAETPSSSISPVSPYDWARQARPNQRLPEGNWRTWLILAGRGFGKTRTGAESVRQLVDSGACRRIAFVAQTLEEVRSVMIEGVSGLLAVYPPDDPNRPSFDFRARRIRWPNGAIGELFDADRPNRLRGPQFDLAWVDELAKFRQPESFFNQLTLTLRQGPNPRCLITTTPRTSDFLKRLARDPSTRLTQGSTFDNRANLPESFLEAIAQRFTGTRIGIQEIEGGFLEGSGGALWRREIILHEKPDRPLDEIVVAIDPAVTRTGDETGLIVAGRLGDRAFVLEDASGHFSPREWTERAVALARAYEARTIIAEVNQGGDLVEAMLRTVDARLPFKAVHATRGKAIRAEPVVALYEQGRIFHADVFTALEHQMCSFGDGSSTSSGEAAGVSSGYAFYGTQGDVLARKGRLVPLFRRMSGCALEDLSPQSTRSLSYWKSGLLRSTSLFLDTDSLFKVSRFVRPFCRFLNGSKVSLRKRPNCLGRLCPKGAFMGVSEDEGMMAGWEDDFVFSRPPSPDRMDALVWALTELFGLDAHASFEASHRPLLSSLEESFQGVVY